MIHSLNCVTFVTEYIFPLGTISKKASSEFSCLGRKVKVSNVITTAALNMRGAKNEIMFQLERLPT